MGATVHNHIVVTSSSKKDIFLAKEKADSLGLKTSDFYNNGKYWFFYVIPDAGKDGREISNEFDDKRNEFLFFCIDKVLNVNFVEFEHNLEVDKVTITSIK